MSNSPFCTRNSTRSSDTIPGQIGPENNGNKRVIHIPQISWFSVTVLPLCRDAVGIFYSPNQWSKLLNSLFIQLTYMYTHCVIQKMSSCLHLFTILSKLTNFLQRIKKILTLLSAYLCLVVLWHINPHGLFSAKSIMFCKQIVCRKKLFVTSECSFVCTWF